MDSKRSIRVKVLDKIKAIGRKRRNVRMMKSIVEYKGDHLQRFGNGYGGYMLSVKSIESTSPLVLSFGIGEDLSFSETVIKELNATVYAYDPTPKAAAYVSGQALSDNQHFRFYPYGLSVKTGTEKFYIPENRNYVSCSTHRFDTLSNEYYEVEMHTFANIIGELGIDHVDILKMDIEGSEFDVMGDVLSAGIPVTQIAVEVHDYLMEEREGFSKLKKLMELFRDKGYYLAYISKSGHELTFIRKESGR